MDLRFDGRTDGPTDRPTDRQRDKLMNRLRDEATDGPTDKRVDQWTNGRKQSKKYTTIYNILLITRYYLFLHRPSVHHAIQHLKSFRMICCTILCAFLVI